GKSEERLFKISVPLREPNLCRNDQKCGRLPLSCRRRFGLLSLAASADLPAFLQDPPRKRDDPSLPTSQPLQLPQRFTPLRECLPRVLRLLPKRLGARRLFLLEFFPFGYFRRFLVRQFHTQARQGLAGSIPTFGNLGGSECLQRFLCRVATTAH